jgi:hypothetical protein
LLLFEALTGLVVIVVLNNFLASISALLGLPPLAITIGIGSDSVCSGSSFISGSGH